MPGEPTRIQFMSEVAESLSVITTNDSIFLGAFDVVAKKIHHALEIKRVDIEVVTEWMKAYNVGELNDITLHGATSYRSRQLNKKEKHIVDNAWYHMKRAIEYVLEYAQNDLFDSFMKDEQ
ncbi:hypothetical protein LCGC14_1611280 [marine sediment metagenome]|uniref:Uncharacterized protein n=1 Tax=marine sediment metagenome TaxID=412755 RepID=A0A0F9I866_9ZZZZ